MDLVHLRGRGADERGRPVFPGPRSAARRERRRQLALLEVPVRRALRLCDRTPYTDIVGEIVRRVYDPGANTYGTRGGGSQTEFSAARATARACRRRSGSTSTSRDSFSVRGTTIAPYLSVVNAYNAKNVFLYVFDYSKSSADAASDQPVPSPPVGRCHDSVLGARCSLARSARDAARGCEIGEITIPPTAPSVVVHAVLNPALLTQVVLARADVDRRADSAGLDLRRRRSDR